MIHIPAKLANLIFFSFLFNWATSYLSINLDDYQVDQKPDESSQSRAASANSEYEKLLAYCTSGGGKRGMERHTVKNKKVFVRERIAR